MLDDLEQKDAIVSLVVGKQIVDRKQALKARPGSQAHLYFPHDTEGDVRARDPIAGVETMRQQVTRPASVVEDAKDMRKIWRTRRTTSAPF